MTWEMLLAAANPDIIPPSTTAIIAHELAWQARWIAACALIIVLALGGLLLWVSFKLDKITGMFNVLLRQTNGLKDDLVCATRKLATLEGNIQGRKDAMADMRRESETKEKTNG